MLITRFKHSFVVFGKNVKRAKKVLLESIVIGVFLISTPANALDVSNKTIVGNFEKITILPGEITFKAKIDTGAKNSSMHATDIEAFSQNEKNFVRFNTQNNSGKNISLELPISRMVLIKRHGQKSQRRAVVKLGICMGSTYKKVEVTLTDRTKFSARFLIGASFLRDSFIVDVSNSYTKKSSCTSIAS